jgi:hypothetical protein
VIAAIQEEGTCWCGGTVWQGHHQRLGLGNHRRGCGTKPRSHDSLRPPTMSLVRRPARSINPLVPET